MAIEAFQYAQSEIDESQGKRAIGQDWSYYQNRINACKEALEQPQPRLFLDLSNSHGNHPVEQPAWQGLTDDEIDEITDELNISLILSCDIIDFVMAIEQALKQKNTP